MYYIAYGSNLNVEQMKYRCPNSIIVGVGLLKNYKLVFKYHADVIKCKGESVPILVWNIDDSDEKALDYYEGYPKYYTKIYEDVLVNGKKIKGMIYVMTDKIRTKMELPYTGYLECIAEGYKENNLDLQYLKDKYNECYKYVNNIKAMV